MEAPKFTDFLVASASGGELDPGALDRTVNSFGAALVQGAAGEYAREGGCYVMRVFGDPGFVRFACEHQGYCKIVGETDSDARQTAEVLDTITESVGFVYAKVAEAYAKRINDIFETEETLKACFAKCLGALKFDRTDHWSGILYREMGEAWRGHGPDARAGLTTYDRFEILDALADHLDFNLYSQVALNLQDWSLVTYKGGDSEKQLSQIARKWEKYGSTPLSPGATMVKEAFRPQDIDWNKDLSTVKSLKTITGITPDISFRVTPKGSTPAFADSQNFSTIGIGGDQYVNVARGHTAWYVAWKPGTAPWILAAAGDGFTTPGIPYVFHSKSGGTILNEVLFARGIAFAFWTGLGKGTLCMPRMNSVMVVTPQGEDAVREVFGSLGQPMLELFRDKRGY